MKVKATSQTTEYEACVLCHVKVPIRRDTPIEDREFYLSGAGQLCLACYSALQSDSSMEDITKQLKAIHHI